MTKIINPTPIARRILRDVEALSAALNLNDGSCDLPGVDTLGALTYAQSDLAKLVEAGKARAKASMVAQNTTKWAGAHFVALFDPERVNVRLDQSRLKADMPKVYEQYTVRTPAPSITFKGTGR